MILPTIIVNTTLDIFDVNFKVYVREFEYENDCEIDYDQIIVDKFINRYVLSFNKTNDYYGGKPINIFGELETYPILENERFGIRVATYVIKPIDLWNDFLISLYQRCHKIWLITTEPVYSEFVFDFSHLDNLEWYIIKVYRDHGFNKEYYRSGLILQESDDLELEKRRKRLLKVLKRRLPPIEESEDLNSTRSQPESKKGMSEWRERRAYLFKEVKDKNPRLTYDQVAAEATDMVHNEIEEQIRKTNPGMDNEKLEYMVLEKFKNEYNNGRKEFSGDDVDNDFDVKEWTWIDSRKFDE